MNHFPPTRAALPLAVLLLAGLKVGPARAQTPSALPVNGPTGQALAAGTAGPITMGVTARKADVDYTGGLLQISANNSSLNQILRDVSRLTGMKITGGVTDDRVFGTYGPAPASAVLTSLLDGTSSNVLIVQNAAAGPAELILTPRKGEPTPPNPNAAPEDEDANRDLPRQGNRAPLPFQPGRPGLPGRSLAPNGLGALPPSNGGQTGTPIDGGADIGQTPGAFTPAGETPPDATAQPAVELAPSTDPGDQPDATRSGGGAITPQQIYEQLQRLRQQQSTVPE